MIRRLLPALLASTLLATSGLAGVAFHLCGMEGAVRSSCCCHKADQANDEPVQLKRLDDCCGAVMSAGEHPLVNANLGHLSIDPPLFIGAVSFAQGSVWACDDHASWAFSGRPPPTHGPPLFVRHCAFLN